MCGIVGAVAQRDVIDILLEGLRRLEYRGYDSVLELLLCLIYEEGDEGNGIKTVSLYRMFTPTFSAPSSSDSSWASYTDGNTTYVPEKLSSQSNPPKNYLWEKKVTSYTKTNSTTVEIRLVAQIDMGVCANLLQDTAFASDGQMEAWTVRNQYSPVSGQSTPAESGAGEIKTNVTLDGQNSYYDKTAYGTDKLTYKEILQQIIYQTATAIRLQRAICMPVRSTQSL